MFEFTIKYGRVDYEQSAKRTITIFAKDRDAAIRKAREVLNDKNSYYRFWIQSVVEIQGDMFLWNYGGSE